VQQLEVHEAFDFDIYNDIVRVHKSHRGRIDAGSICGLRVIKNGSRSNPCFVIVRGLQEAEVFQERADWIRIDEVTRRKLGIVTFARYDFELTKLPWPMHLCWAWTSANPGTRVAIHWAIFTAVISFLLGLAV
jgi:hypothetical protein